MRVNINSATSIASSASLYFRGSKGFDAKNQHKTWNSRKYMHGTICGNRVIRSKDDDRQATWILLTSEACTLDCGLLLIHLDLKYLWALILSFVASSKVQRPLCVLKLLGVLGS